MRDGGEHQHGDHEVVDMLEAGSALRKLVEGFADGCGCERKKARILSVLLARANRRVELGFRHVEFDMLVDMKVRCQVGSQVCGS